MKRYVSRGMTLIEVMIVLIILAIIVALSAPSFSNLILSNQISGDASDFVDALRRAKTESNSRLTTVTVCIRNGNACSANTATGWNNGWLVFLDVNGNGAVNTGDGDTIIYEHEALDQQITVTTAGSDGNPRLDTDGNTIDTRRILYRPSGSTDLDQVGATIFIFGDQGNAVTPRRILVTVAGHASPCATGGC